MNSRSGSIPVSYTHLDVYKRQVLLSSSYHFILLIPNSSSFSNLAAGFGFGLIFGILNLFKFIQVFYKNVTLHGICLLYTSRCV